MERQLSLEIVRVTEAAALSASQWIGRGLKNEADEAATASMRQMFNSVAIQGRVVIGEGEMDEAPMLYVGEKLGCGDGPAVDIAVDPVEGTELVSKGGNGALAVVAIADQGNLLHAPDMYMQKLAVGPALKHKLSLDDPLELTLRKAAEHLGKNLSELNVSILDRDRHTNEMNVLRDAGVRIQLLSAGDVAGAMAPAFADTGVDLYVGSGGAPEGVLAAAALYCLGGELQGRLMPANDIELQRCLDMGIGNPFKTLRMEDMIGTDDVIFAATGITPGHFLGGVRALPEEQAETHSVVMRAKTRTIRFLRAIHYMPGKPAYAQSERILAEEQYSNVI